MQEEFLWVSKPLLERLEIIKHRSGEHWDDIAEAIEMIEALQALGPKADYIERIDELLSKEECLATLEAALDTAMKLADHQENEAQQEILLHDTSSNAVVESLVSEVFELRKEKEALIGSVNCISAVNQKLKKRLKAYEDKEKRIEELKREGLADIVRSMQRSAESE